MGCVYIHIYIYVYVYILMYIHIYIYIYIYISVTLSKRSFSEDPQSRILAFGIVLKYELVWG